jgi:hypothetical protein
MNWNEHILSIKAKAGKNEHHQMPSPHQMGGQPRKPSHNTQNDNNKHLKIRRRGTSYDRFQAETFRILNEKYEHHSKIYTDGSKKDEKVGYAVVLSESTIKRRQFPQNSIFRAISHNKWYLLHCELQPKTSNHH